MIKVLIPCRSVSDKENCVPPILGVRRTYLEKMYLNKLTPLFVAPGMPEEMIDALYEESIGLLLTGGEDVNPQFYAHEPHPATQSDDYGRDELELTLTKTFLADKKPILGICRGCQVLAVAAGGSLVQHLPDVVSDELHDDRSSMMANACMHPVVLTKDSKIAQICGGTSVKVNSYHHQAVAEPGNDMIVSGRSPKGVVECIEHRDRRFFCIGVHSHPENETGDLEELFVAFAAACRGGSSR